MRGRRRRKLGRVESPKVGRVEMIGQRLRNGIVGEEGRAHIITAGAASRLLGWRWRWSGPGCVINALSRRGLPGSFRIGPRDHREGFNDGISLDKNRLGGDSG